MDSRTHVRRIVILLVVLVAAGLIVQRLLRPATFGEIGHYRAASLGEIAAKEPVHQTRSVCATCHGDIHDVHQKDVHWRVQCEVCHGPGDVHVRSHATATPGMAVPDAARMPKTYDRDGCLLCHRQLVARPRDFAQVDPVAHFAFLHVTEPETACIECHSPHEPLFLQEPVHEARLHPVVFECNDCHNEQPTRSHRDVADHPVIFECSDCHPSVAHDFAKRAHAFLRCTACHLYHPENEVSGRVYLNGGKRFCLLCHEQKPFKDASMPQIALPAHIEQMAPVMRRDPEPLLDDPESCLRCHFDFIHDAGLMRRLQEQER